MKKFFTTDISTKLLALAVAFILWVYLMVLLNPEIETSFSNIPITYSEHSNLTKNGYVITSDSVESVSLKVRGPRNMLANANKSNISAYIDLTGCSETGTHSLPINVRLPYEELSVVSKSPYNVSITVDKVINRNYDLEVITEGTPKNKFYLDSLKSNIKTINVEGPSELVKSIESVVACVDINGIDRDKTLETKVEILNNRGETIKNKLLTLSVEKVEVSCTVLTEKSVKVDFSNIKVPSGYEIASVTPDEITIIGRQEVLETIDSVKTFEKWIEAKTGAITKVEINVPRDVEAKDTSVEIVLKEKGGE